MDFIVSLFGSSLPRPHPSLDTQLLGPRVLLRMGQIEDWQAWQSVRGLSRDYLEPWEPKWPDNALTSGYYCSILRRHWREWRSGKGYAFAILRRTESKALLMGGITLGDVKAGPAWKATVGYWIGEPYAGQGYMTESLGLVCDFGFSALKLSRIEASCLPHNEASKSVLRRCGFLEEGYAKDYMQINGRREDHILWGKLNPVRDLS
jgi:ribosomal-protein-alanine N-acetyltransferase